jgi:pimeloyl-ACP methyl ester carboxylesterase
VYPFVQALWCQPKCFRAMSDHLAALEETAAAAGAVTSLRDIPLVIISSGDQPSETIAMHRKLARLSTQSRHIVAEKSGHWIQFDEPSVVVNAIHEVVERARRTHAA